jgi:hypothetical protein
MSYQLCGDWLSGATHANTFTNFLVLLFYKDLGVGVRTMHDGLNELYINRFRRYVPRLMLRSSVIRSRESACLVI